MQPLNVEEYETVKEYIDKYGLNPLSTVMFLCTHEGLIFIYQYSYVCIYFLF